MASSGGNSSCSTKINHSGSKEGLQQWMDQRKRKRMQSNRESAMRSRMRKQKYLDELMAQVTQLRTDNSQIFTSISITTQHYLSVEAENSILRAQMVELSRRLESLNDILSYINTSNGIFEATDHGSFLHASFVGGLMNNPINTLGLNQPIFASADMFLQC